MKYAFFGTPEFAAVILKKLVVAGMKPELVVCNPDKPVGRKKILTPPPVKEQITNNKWQIELVQPETKEEIVAIRHKLLAIKPDVFVVAAYGKIIPKQILEIPSKKTIGVHPSLLPVYRGPSPIQTAILNGDAHTGTSLFLIDEQVDHGPILAQKMFASPITNYSFTQLQNELALLSAKLLIETLPSYISGKLIPQEQNHAAATYCKKFTTNDGKIEFEGLKTAIKLGGKLAIHIDRKIRALEEEPGVWTVLPNGKRMKLLSSEVSRDKKLILKTIQIEGKTPTNIIPDELTK